MIKERWPPTETIFFFAFHGKKKTLKVFIHLEGVFFSPYGLLQTQKIREKLFLFLHSSSGRIQQTPLPELYVRPASVCPPLFFLWLYSKEEKCMHYDSFINKLKRSVFNCDRLVLLLTIYTFIPVHLSASHLRSAGFYSMLPAPAVQRYSTSPVMDRTGFPSRPG